MKGWSSSQNQIRWILDGGSNGYARRVDRRRLSFVESRTRSVDQDSHQPTRIMLRLTRHAALHSLALALTVCVATAVPLTAQTASYATRVAQAVSDKVMRAHLDFLADDALEGRGTATRGGLLASKYIASEFERMGLEPAGDSGGYFQRVPFIAITPEPALRGPAPHASARTRSNVCARGAKRSVDRATSQPPRRVGGQGRRDDGDDARGGARRAGLGRRALSKPEAAAAELHAPIGQRWGRPRWARRTSGWWLSTTSSTPPKHLPKRWR